MDSWNGESPRHMARHWGRRGLSLRMGRAQQFSKRLLSHQITWAICSAGGTDGHQQAGLGKGDFLVFMFKQMGFSSTIQVATLSKQQLGKWTFLTCYRNDLLRRFPFFPIAACILPLLWNLSRVRSLGISPFSVYSLQLFDTPMETHTVLCYPLEKE